MRPRRVSVLAGLTAVAALTAGCSSSGNLEEPQPALSTVAAPSAEDSTNEDAVTETVTKEAPAEKKTKSEKPKEKEKKCASLPKDPREQYPDGSQPGRMPAEDWEDYNFWIGQAGVENHYDPCAPVSWIIFRGGLGSTGGPAHTGASMTNGIAFYVNGEPVDEMTLFTSVENVEENSDGTVEFTWGERTRSTAEGITAYFTVILAPRDGAMVPVSGNGGEFSERWNEPRNKFLLGHYD